MTLSLVSVSGFGRLSRVCADGCLTGLLHMLVCFYNYYHNYLHLYHPACSGLKAHKLTLHHLLLDSSDSQLVEPCRDTAF